MADSSEADIIFCVWITEVISILKHVRFPRLGSDRMMTVMSSSNLAMRQENEFVDIFPVLVVVRW